MTARSTQARLEELTLPQRYDRLTQPERRAVRMEYVRQQDGKCHYCGNPLDGIPAEKITSKPIRWAVFPPNFQQWPVHLHHSHKTGLTIGAVHMRCNAYLWQYEGE